MTSDPSLLPHDFNDSATSLDAGTSVDAVSLPEENEDEPLNETQYLYDDSLSAGRVTSEDLTIEVIPMKPGEATCPSCFLVVPAASITDGHCRECY